MADFKLLTNRNLYIGASTDTKPSTCLTGSTCYEYDTGDLYITYDGGAHWQLKPSEQSVADALANLSNLDIALTTLRDAIVKTGATSKTLADVVSTLGSPLQAGGTVVNANLDIALSALRDALTGSGAAAKTLANIVTALGSPLQAGGNVVMAGVTAAKLQKADTAVLITCTLADTDYAAAAAMPAGTKYVKLYCPSAFVYAVGQATSATAGDGAGSGVPVLEPVTVTGTAADDTIHVSSPTAGAVVRVTYKASA